MDSDPLVVLPEGAEWVFVLAHGAGAGPHHPFLRALTGALAVRRVGTWRFAFPYLAAGRKLPDRAPVLVAAVREACERARATGLRLVAGGKSMGGRMASLAAADPPGLPVEGLAFLGFPLHPAKKPGIERAAHLDRVSVPMLFLQGTKDALAEPALLGPIVGGLPRARVSWVDGADHGFEVPKRVGTPERVVDRLATEITGWLGGLGEP